MTQAPEAPARTRAQISERTLPLIMQNLHRYFVYLVVLISNPEHLRVDRGVPPARSQRGFLRSTILQLTERAVA